MPCAFFHGTIHHEKSRFFSELRTVSANYLSASRADIPRALPVGFLHREDVSLLKRNEEKENTLACKLLEQQQLHLGILYYLISGSTKSAEFNSSRKSLFYPQHALTSTFILHPNLLVGCRNSSLASGLEGLAVREDLSVTNDVMSNDGRRLQEGVLEELLTLNQAEDALPNYLSGPDGNDEPPADEVLAALGSNSISPGPELTATKVDCTSGENHPHGEIKARNRERRNLLQRGESCHAPLLNAPTGTNQHPETERKPIDTPEDQSPTSEQQEPDLLEWTDLFKVSTQDGDSPACFEHTRGLLPIGVCDSLGIGPVPSRFDIYERKNLDIIPKVWKLNNCFLCAYSPK